MEKRMEEKRKELIVIVAAIGVGFILGTRAQKAVNLKNLQGVVTFTKVVNPTFPATMSIAEIKEIVKATPNSSFTDALLVNLDGAQKLIIR